MNRREFFQAGAAGLALSAANAHAVWGAEQKAKRVGLTVPQVAVAFLRWRPHGRSVTWRRGRS